jgi:uncharacterized protein (DUF488 family)
VRINLVIFTIGFTQKTAEKFFKLLSTCQAKYLLDIRLNNKSQLAGFTKRDDLPFFLNQLVGMEYKEMPIFAPDEMILKQYRKNHDWTTYERLYLELLTNRQAEKYISNELIEQGSVLLCSEAQPAHCHRRLAAEYLIQKNQNIANIVHL